MSVVTCSPRRRRQHSIATTNEARLAVLEPSGRISFITREADEA